MNFVKIVILCIFFYLFGFKFIGLGAIIHGFWNGFNRYHSMMMIVSLLGSIFMTYELVIIKICFMLLTISKQYDYVVKKYQLIKKSNKMIQEMESKNNNFGHTNDKLTNEELECVKMIDQKILSFENKIDTMIHKYHVFRNRLFDQGQKLSICLDIQYVYELMISMIMSMMYWLQLILVPNLKMIHLYLQKSNVYNNVYNNILNEFKICSDTVVSIYNTYQSEIKELSPDKQEISEFDRKCQMVEQMMNTFNSIEKACQMLSVNEKNNDLNFLDNKQNVKQKDELDSMINLMLGQTLMDPKLLDHKMNIKLDPKLNQNTNKKKKNKHVK